MPFSFFKWKRRGLKRAVGLDIGSHSVKMVAVSGIPGSLALTDCAVSWMEASSENPVPADALKRAIAETVGRSGLDLSNLRISVSGRGTIVRHAEMPRMNSQELKSSIRYEAEMLLPFSLDDCIFDCQILDPDNRSSARMRVILAAARKSVVQERLNLIKDFGLVPSIISIDSLALANAFESAMAGMWTAGGALRESPIGSPEDTRRACALPQTQDGAQKPAQGSADGQTQPSADRETSGKGAGDAVLVVHIGAVRTILAVMSATGLEFTRDIEVGGNHATLAIARGLGIGFQEAERRKKGADAAAKEFISSMVMALSRELRSTSRYVSSKMNKNVGRIYLSGGGALCQGLREAVTAELGIAVSPWNPLQGISAAGEATSGESGSRGEVMAIAAGLALTD